MLVYLAAELFPLCDECTVLKDLNAILLAIGTDRRPREPNATLIAGICELRQVYLYR